LREVVTGEGNRPPTAEQSADRSSPALRAERPELAVESRGPKEIRKYPMPPHAPNIGV
jgi:hypothetical protein